MEIRTGPMTIFHRCALVDMCLKPWLLANATSCAQVCCMVACSSMAVDWHRTIPVDIMMGRSNFAFPKCHEERQAFQVPDHQPASKLQASCVQAASMHLLP